MNKVIKKSDFVLGSYMQSNDLWATYQILNTIIPYIALWFLAFKVAFISIWILPPIIVLITLFSVRCFSLMHDCGHYSLFRSKKINRIIGFLLGVINAIPQYAWSRDHAYHHKTNGDWEQYRGVADFLSTEEFSKLSVFQQRLYEILRYPIMVFPGGFFYLAIKPRLALLMGFYDFIVYLFSCLKTDFRQDLLKIIALYPSKYWQTTEEFLDLVFNNICVVSGWVILSRLLGAGFFLGTYSIVLTLSAAIFICVFFVQHNFEGSYAHKTEGWSYLRGALEGSSYLQLPTLLKWFTADIGYHNIHHLSERIPNYNLQSCHNENIHLLADLKILRVRDMLYCFKFILWDSDSNKLISIKTFRQGEQLKTEEVFTSPFGK